MAMTEVISKSPDFIAKLSGKVDASNCEAIQQESLAFLEEGGFESFTFDVNDVTYISSAGLRMFSAVNKECKGKDIPYKLTGLREDLMKMFRLTGYASVFKIEVKES